MSFLRRNRTNTLILILVVLMAGLGYWYRPDIQESTNLLLGICGFALLLILLFYNFSWYYYLMIGLIPISISTGAFGGAKLDFPGEGLLVLALPVLFLFSKKYREGLVRVFAHPLTILLAVDLFIQIITSLSGTHIDISIKRVLIRFFFIAGFYVVLNMIDSKKLLIKPWLFYVIGLVPVMYFTFNNHIHHSFNPRVVFSISKPFYSDHTIYGACLAFVIPILLIVVFRRKIFQINGRYYLVLIVVTLLVITAQIFALSRASILSLVVALCFLGLLYFKVKFQSIIYGLVMVLVSSWAMKDTIYSYIESNEAVSNDGELVNHFSSVTNVQSDASNLERINRWICAVRMFEERPLLGYGPGTYQFEYNQFQTVVNKTHISTNSGNRGNAHSEYLTYLSETGIFGFIVFLLTVFGSIYYGMQNHYLVEDPLLKLVNLGVLLGLVTYYFHGIFNAFMDQSKMGFLYFTALGTVVWINQRLRVKNEAR